MPADIPLNKRTYYNRKTIPQTGRVHKQTDTIIRIEDTNMNRMKYRSRFELHLAKGLAENKVKADRVKMALVKQQHKDLDIRFVFMNARNKIYKGSKTTYADWCNKHDYRWAEKSIPVEWYKNGK